MTALLLFLLIAGVAFAAWTWATGDSVSHVGYHRSPTVRRYVLAGGEAILVRSEPDWG